jgi:hypothetical protein
MVISIHAANIKRLPRNREILPLEEFYDKYGDRTQVDLLVRVTSGFMGSLQLIRREK